MHQVWARLAKKINIALSGDCASAGFRASSTRGSADTELAPIRNLAVNRAVAGFADPVLVDGGTDLGQNPLTSGGVVPHVTVLVCRGVAVIHRVLRSLLHTSAAGTGARRPRTKLQVLATAIMRCAVPGLHQRRANLASVHRCGRDRARTGLQALAASVRASAPIRVLADNAVNRARVRVAGSS